MASTGMPAKRRPWIAGLVVLALIVAWRLTPEPKPRLVTLSGPTMGTTYTVKVVASQHELPAKDETRLQDDIAEKLFVINQLMSTYIPDSELSRLNRHAGTDPFKVSADTMEVLRLAGQISDASGGAFDITVGPVVNLYGFGPDPAATTLPSEAELDAIRPRIGYRLVELGPDNTVRKLRPDIYCDLSAIAKGYAVDQVAMVLEDWDFKNYMVEIGGEVRVRGVNARGVPWVIGIERPSEGEQSVQREIAVPDVAIATSGDYRNVRHLGGRRLSHTVDPRTGRLADHTLGGVTVLHENCASADAWATAMMVLGPDEGYNLAERLGLAVLFVTRESDGRMIERASSRFAEWVAPQATPATATAPVGAGIQLPQSAPS